MQPAPTQRQFKGVWQLPQDIDPDGAEAKLEHGVLTLKLRKMRESSNARQIEARDVDVLILRSEQFGPFELDDAVLARELEHVGQAFGAEALESVRRGARLVGAHARANLAVCGKRFHHRLDGIGGIDRLKVAERRRVSGA